VRRELSTDLANRAIEWRIGELPTVRGDRALLHQVVANLVGNAVKFTRRRQPAIIEIDTCPPDSAAPEQATWYVRDNGAGFNPAYVDKLFGVFQRLHNTSEFEGTGIGLANVKRIVVRHGGSVRAEGEVNVGATFLVTLPVATTTVATPPETFPAAG
jgi:light-regulated signal transduction histidine kinase (bacteriophytochrome)